eukprot:CAMPEP_0116874120 /NCGR_PEP_ID=MMETSP0463-20121206/5550_1 /TAXON_ID=181622 /ORGANISM="Strombidinopsis sp, Strain SopsisLIS2011" /LENGTH=73 /DNA_ID=CAMNT_0004517383 /DNA_START=133 /DNA_END=354 /DNA_ORIENTATION=+
MVDHDPLLAIVKDSLMDSLGIDLANKTDVKVAIETEIDSGTDFCENWESWVYETTDSQIKWQSLAQDPRFTWV